VWLATLTRGGAYEHASWLKSAPTVAVSAVNPSSQVLFSTSMSRTKLDQEMSTRIVQWAIVIVTLSAIPIGASAQTTDFPTKAAAELANLHEGVTLEAWMDAHPNDAPVLYSHRRWDWGNWIVRADYKDRLMDGREIIRRAYFYAPDPPADMSLPRSASQQRLRASAQLGFIWIETNEPVAQAGSELAERTREELSNRLAKGKYDLKLWFANAAYWSKTAKWIVGTATFASAYESIDDRIRPGRVLAFGFLPASGLHVDLGGGEDVYGEAFDAALGSLDDAIAASGLSEKDLEPIRLVKQRIKEYHSGNSEMWKSATNNEIVDALKHWLSTSRRRGRRQYAAALLAADTALDLSEQLVNADDETTRKRLHAIGANFVYAQLDGYMYTHDWLKKALRLDRGGPIGDLSLISMMERGFAVSMLADTHEGSGRVIFEGERFLSRSRNPNLRRRVHLLVAEAYSDVVALADGSGEEYFHAAKYLSAAPWAKSMAIAHYRHLLRLPRALQNPKRIWKQAWRLLAGAPPTGTHFLCVYD
jgi:hypothetical protein